MRKTILILLSLLFLVGCHRLKSRQGFSGLLACTDYINENYWESQHFSVTDAKLSTHRYIESYHYATNNDGPKMSREEQLEAVSEYLDVLPKEDSEHDEFNITIDKGVSVYISFYKGHLSKIDLDSSFIHLNDPTMIPVTEYYDNLEYSLPKEGINEEMLISLAKDYENIGYECEILNYNAKKYHNKVE